MTEGGILEYNFYTKKHVWFNTSEDNLKEITKSQYDDKKEMLYCFCKNDNTFYIWDIVDKDLEDTIQCDDLIVDFIIEEDRLIMC